MQLLLFMHLVLSVGFKYQHQVFQFFPVIQKRELQLLKLNDFKPLLYLKETWKNQLEWKKYQKHMEIQKSGKAESQNRMYCWKITKYKTGSLFSPAA